MTATTEIRSIDLKNIVLSQTTAQIERRKQFDKTAISELANSIKVVGLINPILVRPMGDQYEVVAGERRYLASKEAQLDSVNATIRDLNDQQVLEVQLIENLQREGLHELAEAEGYEALMKNYKFTADDLVAKVGRSRSYIYGRLKLLALCKACRKAFYAGEINGSLALLLARLPTEAMQTEALKEIGEGGFDGEPMSYREALDHIQQRYMLRLDQAPFKTEDPNLVAKAGPCGTCPKRTGNQQELFGDVKSANVCTDPTCFGLKKLAAIKIKIETAKENGQEVITGKAAKDIAPYGSLNGGSGLVNMTDGDYFDGKYKTYKQLLGKDAPAPTLVILEDRSEVIEAIDRKKLNAALKEKGIDAPTSKSPLSNSEKAERKKVAEENALRLEIAATVHLAVPAKLDITLLRIVALSFYHSVWHECQKKLAAQWSFVLDEAGEKKIKGKPWMRSELLDALIEKKVGAMSEADVSKFLVDCAVVSDLQTGTFRVDEAETLDMVAKHLRINPDAIKKKLKTAEGEKAKDKPAAKKTVKPAAKKAAAKPRAKK